MARVTYATLNYAQANMRHVLQFDSDTQIWYDRVLDLQEHELFELYSDQGKLVDLFDQIHKALIRSGVPEPEATHMTTEIEGAIRQHANWGSRG
jgi:hypothetical protein